MALFSLGYQTHTCTQQQQKWNTSNKNQMASVTKKIINKEKKTAHRMENAHSRPEKELMHSYSSIANTKHAYSKQTLLHRLQMHRKWKSQLKWDATSHTLEQLLARQTRQQEAVRKQSLWTLAARIKDCTDAIENHVGAPKTAEDRTPRWSITSTSVCISQRTGTGIP